MTWVTWLTLALALASLVVNAGVLCMSRAVHWRVQAIPAQRLGIPAPRRTWAVRVGERLLR